MHAKDPPLPAPLVSLPLVEVLFDWIVMDFVATLPSSASFHFLLDIMDYAAKYSEIRVVRHPNVPIPKNGSAQSCPSLAQVYLYLSVDLSLELDLKI